MPQKSVEPVPTLSSTISRGPAASNSRAIPARRRDRPIAVPIGLERLQGELGGLRAAAPSRPVEAERDGPLVLGSAFDDGADRHASLSHAMAIDGALLADYAARTVWALLVIVVTLLLARAVRRTTMRVLARSRAQANVTILLGNLAQVAIIVLGMLGVVAISRRTPSAGSSARSASSAWSSGSRCRTS